MRQLSFTVLFSLAAFVQANAADPAVPTEVAPVVFDWGGGYVGAQAGYGWGKNDITFPIAPGSSVLLEPKGFVGGLYAGYNYLLQNNLLIGIEADVGFGGQKDGSNILVGGVPLASEFWESEVKVNGALRARFGFAADRTLFYATGGLALAQIETTRTRPGIDVTQDSSLFTGWTAGLGIEHAFSDHWTARLDYRYQDLGSKDVTAQPATTTISDFSSHDIRIGIAYKF